MSQILIHPNAEVETDLVGVGTRIWRWTHVSKGARIGKHCVIGQGVYVGNNVIIGDYVRIQNNAYIPEMVVIEDEVFISPCCVFVNYKYPRSPRTDQCDRSGWEATLVRKGASVGANATILCGLVLGEHCMVGAGSVVTKDVPPYSTVYGNPAACHN